MSTVKKLFYIGASQKTRKSDKSSSPYKTAIMYLAPATNVTGINVCSMAAVANCLNACLYRSGLASVYSTINEARKRKTELLRDDKPAFMAMLVKDSQRELKRANKNGYKLAVRLNGTSDWPFENESVIVGGKKYPNIMRAFPTIVFYDYSKVISAARIRKIAAIPNYSVTASYSEADIKYAKKIAWQGSLNIAVVFRDTIPDFFTLANGKTLPVISGEKNDERFLDPTDKQYVIALKAKGPARKDTSGFVIDNINVIARAA